MNLNQYLCNAEGLYFLHLLFYPKISPDFQRHISRHMPETNYNSFELNVFQWLITVNFRNHLKSIFMGIDQSLRDKGFKIPFHNWGYEVGVHL